ncbi:MAG: SDR family oxidoreductase [Piscinibacter sp.]|uniref:SDR family oxidoreductase n=1 Tax=Piscinibacter sp. TaxID=1903157 RepID=UPI001B64007E|nr:SDR family oxidoreductase [Piscinibacter sp.]MBP5991084.1 SDR family oxidoreductase [Piscinibacter sp.]MBP6028296.1 SDR family oxidoreductase [Piscinibacter sp.]
MSSGARVLVTGGNGYLGHQVVAALAGMPHEVAAVVSLDLRAAPPERSVPGVLQASADIRDADLAALLREHNIDTVVHLAAIVTPGRHSNRELEYQVDVVGTRNVLQACVDAGVKRLVVSSSGAAYGYHADNPAWLSEDAPLRGNEEFAYSWHKRLVEEMLAEARRTHPALEQVVLRIATILGETVANQITALFDKPRPLAVAGSDSPFVFVWDQDVVGVIVQAVRGAPAGVYNVAGDGALSIHQIAAHMGKRCRVLPPALLAAALWLGRRLGLTQYGPEQLRFLQYRPVLDNRRLKEVFGYRPRKTSAEAFDVWWTARQRRAGQP